MVEREGDSLRREEGARAVSSDPEEVALVLKALGFDKNTQIYIAAGEIYVQAGKPDRCKRYNKSEVKEIDEYRKTNTRTIRNRIRK